tara:strand:+ start:607 stop:2997 length:2391 start_codon:yes stop_codon:yes gene_type:complete
MSLTENQNIDSLEVEYEFSPEDLIDGMDMSPEDQLFLEDGIYASDEIEIPIDHFANLAEYLSEDELDTIAGQVIDGFEADKNSRDEWDETLSRGLDLLGLKFEETGTAFQGSCAAVHPLIIESAVKFQSKASQELLPANGPVRTQIIGDPNSDIVQQANRVRRFMNYELTEMMPEYFDEMERMLFHLPIVGSAIVKMYYDSLSGRPLAEHVPIDQFYVNFSATDLRRAARYTHVIYKSPADLQADIQTQMYRDPGSDLSDPSGTTRSSSEISSKINDIMGLSDGGEDPEYSLLEQHVQMKVGDDEMALPYIITIEPDSRQVLSIRRNYEESDPTFTKMLHFTHYRYVPGFGFYGLGLIHLIGNLTMTATSAMRALVDAGQFANLPGGFKAKGVRVVGDSDPISPGEFKEVETMGMDLNKSIINLPYKEPSQTLFQLLGFVTGAAEKFADQTDSVVSDAASYGPVGTTMALLEASAKFFSAVHKRLHHAQRQQFKILARINTTFVPQDGYPYATPEGDMTIYQQDFDGRVDVIPVSDPNIPSRAHRLSLASLALQLSSQSPAGTFNTPELIRQVLEAADFPNIDQIMPKPQQAQPNDPVTDLMLVSKGQPISAFPGQDHQAHIAVKTAFLSDPTTGGSGQMAAFIPIIQSNMREHTMLAYQEQVQALMQQAGAGMGTPPTASAMDQLLVTVAQQITNANQQMGMARSPEQQLLELEKEKLGLEKEKIGLKAIADAGSLAIKNRSLDLTDEKQVAQAAVDGIKIATGVSEAEKDRDEERASQTIDILLETANQQSGEI